MTEGLETIASQVEEIRDEITRFEEAVKSSKSIGEEIREFTDNIRQLLNDAGKSGEEEREKLEAEIRAKIKTDIEREVREEFEIALRRRMELTPDLELRKKLDDWVVNLTIFTDRPIDSIP